MQETRMIISVPGHTPVKNGPGCWHGVEGVSWVGKQPGALECEIPICMKVAGYIQRIVVLVVIDIKQTCYIRTTS